MPWKRLAGRVGPEPERPQRGSRGGDCGATVFASGCAAARPQAAAVPPEHPTAGPPSKLTLLPEWIRHLPDKLASIPEAISDPRRRPSRHRNRRHRTRSRNRRRSRRADCRSRPQSPSRRAKQKVDDSWQEPEALIASLNELDGRPAGKWAAAVLRQLAALKPAMAAGSDEATAILDRLDELSQQTRAVDREAFRQGIRPPMARNRLRAGPPRRHLAAGRSAGKNGGVGFRLAHVGLEETGRLPGRRSRRRPAIRPRDRAWRAFLLIDELKAALREAVASRRAVVARGRGPGACRG